MTGKRAATGLRLVAIGTVVTVVRLILIGILRERATADWRAKGGEISELLATLARYSSISLWGHVACAVVVLIGLALLVSALEKGRGFAIGALAALVLHLALTAVNHAMKLSDPIPLSVKLSWWLNGVGLSLATLLPLVALHRAQPASLTRLAALGALVVMLLDAGTSAYGIAAESYTPTLIWLERSVAMLAAGWLAGFAFPIAARVARGMDAASAEPAPAGTLDGTPLRALGWALLVRITVGILLQAMILSAMIDSDFESAGGLTTLGTTLGALVSVAIFVALFAYQRFPASHRGESLVVAMSLLVVGVVLDIVATSAANDLFGMAARAKGATSIWAMPSLSKLEELELTMTWAGRGGLAVGIGAGFALASSLRQTAIAVSDGALVEKAQRVMKLLVVAGIGALGISLIAGSLSRDLVVVLLLAAIALLAVAVFLLVEWLRLFFGLAAAVERPPPTLG